MNNDKQEHLRALNRALTQVRRQERRFGWGIMFSLMCSIFNISKVVSQKADSGTPLMFSLICCGILVCVHHSYFTKAIKLRRQIFKLTIE